MTLESPAELSRDPEARRQQILAEADEIGLPHDHEIVESALARGRSVAHEIGCRGFSVEKVQRDIRATRDVSADAAKTELAKAEAALQRAMEKHEKLEAEKRETIAGWNLRLDEFLRAKKRADSLSAHVQSIETSDIETQFAARADGTFGDPWELQALNLAIQAESSKRLYRMALENARQGVADALAALRDFAAKNAVPRDFWPDEIKAE